MRTNTIALLISDVSGASVLTDTLTNDQEIQYLEELVQSGDSNPLEQIYQFREIEQKREAELGDFIENLLSKPNVHPQVKQQGIMWFRSKIKLEHFQKIEKDAAKVIAEHAYKIFQKDPEKTDFFLASATSQVRVRIFRFTEQSRIGLNSTRRTNH